MAKRILKSIMSVTIVSLILLGSIVIGIFYQHFEDEIFKQLKTEATYIGAAIESYGNDYLEYIKTDQRITLINEKGEVLYDNQVTDLTLSNHATREEVVEAFETGEGKGERRSETLRTKALYYALLLDNNQVLRIADYQNTALSLLFRFMPMILMVFLASILMSWYIAKKMAIRITQPINNLDLDKPEEEMNYEELKPLIHRINRLTNSLKKQIDEAGKQQEEFKMITDQMSEGVIVISKDQCILSYNNSICAHLQMDTELKGMHIQKISNDPLFTMFVKKTKKGIPSEWIQEKNECYYQWMSNPIQNVGGAVIIVLDITERVKRDVFRSEFTANISHELKTPLTSISGFAEIIQNGIVKDEDVKMFAGDIYKESQRLIRLVNDIIRVSQLDDHRLVYQKEEISVNEEVESIVESLRHIAKKKNVTIQINEEEISIDTVPSIFNEVIYNLVDNAIKYNKENGSVDIQYSKDSKNFTISVEDTGIGISIQNQQRIFERFYRVDKSRSSYNGGTGLGLSIVKHGVTTLGGTIEVKSSIGIGTQMKVILPLNDKE